QHAVERILVKRRQVEGRHRVLAGNRQFAPSVVDQPAAQPARLDAEVLAAQAVLDRHFPQARRAEPEPRARILEQAARLSRQPVRLARRPQQQMRVDQQVHLSPRKVRSMVSCPMRSKSSGTAISPARKPRRRGAIPSRDESGTTLTSGLPALAMMKLSPRAARSTRRDRWVLASCMLTLRMGLLLT